MRDFEEEWFRFVKVVVIKINLCRHVFRVDGEFCRRVDLGIALGGFDEVETAFGDLVFGIFLLFAFCGFGRFRNVRTRCLVLFIGTLHEFFVCQNGTVRGIFAKFAVFIEVEGSLVALGCSRIVATEIRHVGVVVHDLVIVLGIREVIEIGFVNFKGQRVVDGVFRCLVGDVIEFRRFTRVLLELVIHRFDGFGRGTFIILIACHDIKFNRTTDFLGCFFGNTHRINVEHDLILVIYDLEFAHVVFDELIIDVD